MALHKDTQGPAPNGFHIPTIDEWQGLKTVMDGLNLTTGDGWRINLHMPFAGYRSQSDAVLYNQGNNGYYWSSSPYGSTVPEDARYLYLNSSIVNANANDYRSRGFSLRCFKDLYVAPTSSWTVIQGTLGNAGIFWDQTNGLISITSNGTTGYTIMDKNLGATVVYNNGDTLTQANTGNIYQWGNNYGFPSTGTISNISRTQVDTTLYGPGNYYSSDTFIINTPRSSVQNDNLWGGETNGTRGHPDMRLHGAIQTFHWKRPYEWKPGVNTLLYMPLNGDTLDYSGNDNNGTWSGTTEYKTIGDKQYAYINTNSCIDLASSPIGTGNPDDFTFSCWVRINENSYGAQPVYLGSDSTNNRFCLILNYYWSNNHNYQHINDIYWYTIYLGSTTSTPEHKGEWVNVIYTYEKSTQTSTLYINNSQTGTDNGYPINIASGGNYRIARLHSDSNYANYGLSEIIFENGIWSEEDRTNYYNRSKVNYEGGGITLKSYEEIIAMSLVDAQTELRTYPTEYYNKFNSEGHMTTNYFGTVLNWNRNTSSPVSGDYGKFMVYENNNRYGAER